MGVHDQGVMPFAGLADDAGPVVGTQSGLPRKAGRRIDVDAVIGQRFGELVVIGVAPKREGSRRLRVFVRCDCGTERSFPLSQVTDLKRRLMTCGTKEHRDWAARIAGEELVGQTFGLLTVVAALSDRGEERRQQVMTKCLCGEERRVTLSDLRGGSVVTCGGGAHQAVKPQAKRWEVVGPKKTYAIEAVGTGRVKIGAAKDFKDRMLKLQTGCPVALRLIASCNDNIEDRLHQELLEHCTHGEWFVANENVMSTIWANMTPDSMTVKIGRCRFGRAVTKHRCKACGELGHHAKTCGRQFKR